MQCLAVGVKGRMTEKNPHVRVDDSFEDLFNQHYRLVTSALRITCGPTEDIEDLVQNAFIEVFKSLHRFEGRCALSTWIYRIAIHVGLQHRRKKQRWAWIRLFNGEQSAEHFGGPHPVAKLESREALRDLDHRLEGLSEAKRIAFVLVDIEGMTNTEAAAVLNINPNTVRSRLHAARTELLEASKKRGAV